MTPMMSGFADELVKVGTGAMEVATKIPPHVAKELKRLGMAAGVTGAVHGAINPHTNLADMARFGVGFTGGDYLGSRAAKALGRGKWGTLAAGLAGGIAGAKLLKKRKRD